MTNFCNLRITIKSIFAVFLAILITLPSSTYKLFPTSANVGKAEIEKKLLAQTYVQNNLATNGTVNDIEVVGNTVYLAGAFTQVGPNTGSGVIFDLDTHNLENTFPKVNNEIRTVIPDGNGGWFIGGDFTLVGSLPCLKQGLAHILSDGTVDPNFPATFDSGVTALAKSNSILYVGGADRITAVDIKTGNILNWSPYINGQIYTFVVDNSILYVGGYFTQVNGLTRNNLASFDITTGNLTSWNPNVSGLNGWVYDIKVSGNNVYVTGRFTKVGDKARNSLAAIDKFSGIVTDWDPVPYLSSDGSSVVIYETEIVDNVIYVTGNFVKIGGQSRNHLAAIDLSTGKATSWNPIPNIYVGGGFYTLAISGSTLYVGGDFGIFREGGTVYDSEKTIYNLAAIDLVTGIANWNPKAGGPVYSLAISNSKLYAGGRIRTVGGQDRNYLAAIDKATGNLTDWNPNPSKDIRSLTISGSTLYVGGDFSKIGGKSRYCIAAIDTVTGNVTDWNPNTYTYYANGAANAFPLAAVDSMLYIGSSFSIVSGLIRNFFSVVDAVTGEFTSWASNVGDSIHALAIDGPTLYVGGKFTKIGGVARNNLAAIDIETGKVTAWNPSVNYNTASEVNAIAVKNSTVYAGGNSYFGGLVAFDAVTGTLINLNPYIGGEVKLLAVDDSTLYAGGYFSNTDGQGRSLIAIDRATGKVTKWDPNSNSFITAIAIDDSAVYVGGNFTSIGNEAVSYFAKLPLSNANQSPGVPSIVSAFINGINVVAPYSIKPGQILTINFSALDSDLQDTVTLSTPQAPIVGIFAASLPTNPGTATFTYTAPVNPEPSYSFTVRATDNNGAISSSDLTVTFNVTQSVTNISSSSGSVTSTSGGVISTSGGTTNNSNLFPGVGPNGVPGQPGSGTFPGVAPSGQNDQSVGTSRPEGGRPPEANANNNGSEATTIQNTPNHGVGNGNGIGNSKH